MERGIAISMPAAPAVSYVGIIAFFEVRATRTFGRLLICSPILGSVVVVFSVGLVSGHDLYLLTNWSHSCSSLGRMYGHHCSAVNSGMHFIHQVLFGPHHTWISLNSF